MLYFVRLDASVGVVCTAATPGRLVFTKDDASALIGELHCSLLVAAVHFVFPPAQPARTCLLIRSVAFIFIRVEFVALVVVCLLAR